MDDSLFKGYGKDDAVKKAGDALGSVLNQERTSTLTRLTTEISLWAIKEQVRMQQELRPQSQLPGGSVQVGRRVEL